MGIKDALQKLETSEGGLSDAEVKERLMQYGPNKLAEEGKISKFKIFLHQFASPLIYILLVAATITTILHKHIDTGVIMAAVVLNVVIGYFQEYKAEKSIRSLKELIVPKARVLREGKEKEINSIELVPGDIVLLTSGVRVPADIRLLKTIELKIEEAMLTGESLPAEKTTRLIKEDNLTPGDQRNIAFMGTSVLSGRAKGIVVETGGQTVIGQIASDVKEVSVTKTPIQEKMVKFAKFIALIVLSAAVAIFALGLLLGIKLEEMFITAVAASVAAVPEGLPIAVTVAMAIGINKMVRKRAIIRTLPSVETLGSTTVIASDKTGTLTKNEMTVKMIYDGGHSYSVEGSGYEPKGDMLYEGKPVNVKTLKNLMMVLRIGMLCNESSIYEKNGHFKVDGDPTEGALIVSAIKAGLNPDEEKKRYPEIGMVPFESNRGYMATLHKYGNKKYIFIKGAPEKILELCTTCLTKTELKTKEILNYTHIFAKEGMRVLAMAYKEVPNQMDEITHYDAEGELVFVGIQGMIDPPRPDAIEAVKNCKEAGIRVIMITGDHATTASAIAKILTISEEDSIALAGKEIEAMSDEHLFDKIKDTSVFARVSPQHKLRIVQQLIKQGEIVAVTGDGVNDAPALKAAHLGVAMGITGTDVAKESSDMIIVDDNFASIFGAVQEGRVVFSNLRKIINFLIPTGFAAIFSILTAMLMGLPIPYVPAQLLWINLVTNGVQHLALAAEPGEKDIAKRPPKDPKEGVMSRLMYERTVLVGLVLSAGVIYNFVTALNAGASLETARTIAMTTMVFFQFFQTWNSRSELQSIFRIGLFTNPFLFYSIAAAAFMQLAVIYVPALQWVFRTEPIAANSWPPILMVATTIVIAIEFDKWIRRRNAYIKELRVDKLVKNHKMAK